MSILAEWQSTDSYATRFHDINTGTGGGLNGTAKLNFGTTVAENGGCRYVDCGTVGTSIDWFFEGAGDTLHNLKPGDHVNNT